MSADMQYPELPIGKACTKTSEWEDAKTRRQSFNGWRIGYADCDMELYTAAQMRSYADATCALRGADEARQFPDNTCASSRHSQMIGEALVKGEAFPQLNEEPVHCGQSILATVEALYRARTALRGAQKESGWLPISDAPKDGRALLFGWFNSHGKWRTTRGCWFSRAHMDEYFEDPDTQSPGWFETTVEDEDGQCWPIKPSHFQFLPSPPTPEGEAK